jgi:hypothetical protein
LDRKIENRKPKVTAQMPMQRTFGGLIYGIDCVEIALKLVRRACFVKVFAITFTFSHPAIFFIDYCKTIEARP